MSGGIKRGVILLEYKGKPTKGLRIYTDETGRMFLLIMQNSMLIPVVLPAGTKYKEAGEIQIPDDTIGAVFNYVINYSQVQGFASQVSHLLAVEENRGSDFDEAGGCPTPPPT